MSNRKKCQTEVTGGYFDILQEDCQCMQQEIHLSQRKIGVAAFGTEALFDRDKKVLFYTGLPHQELLKILFTYCMSVITASANSAQTPFQKMTLTLCRYRVYTLSLGTRPLQALLSLDVYLLVIP